EEFKAWKAGLVKKLRETSFRALPEKIPVGEPQELVDKYRVRWHTGDGPDLSVRLLGVSGNKRDQILVVRHPDEGVGATGEFWSKTLALEGQYWRIETRGVGEAAWTRKNPPNTVERSMALLGQTVDTGRVRDVASNLVAQAEAKKRVRL